jgi:type IV pilus assembly protein PilQ
VKSENVKNPWINSSAIFAGATVVLMATQPGFAQVAKVTNVQLNQTDSGLNLVLETTTGKRPQVFTSKRGNSFVADIINTQLQLPQGDTFRQDNPAPGVASVIINRLDANSIRIVVMGSNGAPNGQIGDRTNRGFTLSLTPGAPAAAAPGTPPVNTAQTPGGVMVPNPNVTIDGVRTSGAVAPALPRAVAPPVGDIAVSNTDSSAAQIDLGTQERVPRLVLREAPVREVLALLARAAGLNLAFSAAPATGGQASQATEPSGTGANEGPKISLDIENESVQDVFNYVLRLSGLQANREGRTIFVGTKLPNPARDLVVRSFRLNQVTVGVALNFLVGMGAESAVSRERTITSVNAVPVGGSAAPATQTQTSTETRIELQRVDFQDSTPLLRGLQALGDERTNSVTLIGTPKQIDVATSQLVQLDSRRRQVAMNVKIVDINLSAIEDFNTSFSFGIGDNFFTNAAGLGTVNIGGDAPRSTNKFIASLQAQVVGGNAKILTDPTLTVQEGQTAEVNLTQEVPAGIQVQFITANSGGNAIPVQTVTTKEAGLTVGIRIERIDDNGFVSLSVAPSVSSVAEQRDLGGGNLVAFLNKRTLSSGLVRLRDGQTLVLSGIIQDSDRTTVSKVPILGDIPLLGALFRSTNRQNQRQEVVVLLTPQILDDSEGNTGGLGNYNPSPDVRQLLERNRNSPQPATKQLKNINFKN